MRGKAIIEKSGLGVDYRLTDLAPGHRTLDSSTIQGKRSILLYHIAAMTHTGCARTDGKQPSIYAK